MSETPWRYELKTYLADRQTAANAGSLKALNGQPGGASGIRERRMVLLESYLFRDMDRDA